MTEQLYVVEHSEESRTMYSKIVTRNHRPTPITVSIDTTDAACVASSPQKTVKVLCQAASTSVSETESSTPDAGPSRISTPVSWHTSSHDLEQNYHLVLENSLRRHSSASLKSVVSSLEYQEERVNSHEGQLSEPEDVYRWSTRDSSKADLYSSAETVSQSEEQRSRRVGGHPAFQVRKIKPLSNRLDQPQVKLHLKPELNPERSWFGAIDGPGSRKVEENGDENNERAQTTVPVMVLPPDPQVDRIEQALEPQNQPAREKTSAPFTFSTAQFALKARQLDVDGKLRHHARRKILTHKYLMQTGLLSINGFMIFATWWWPRYYYILLPFIMFTVALNVFMVFSIILRRTWNAIFTEKIIKPELPESMVLLIPCYNETKEELLRSLDSLVAQRNIDAHKQAIIIVCDGKVRGPGMEKTTADYLLQDILRHGSSREYVRSAYTAWDQQPMDVVVQRGTYGGTPYYCIVKQQNQGKRDGLIVARSFLYNFNRRNEAPTTVFSPRFFDSMASFLLNDAGIDNVVHLIGMDADTVFADDCIHELLLQSRYSNTMGVCGYVAVDWKSANWNPWRLYQSSEYTIAQALRRLHQSIVTHKVSCLPGCCQLLRVCEETCGDHVLIELFGYCPEITDGLLKQIRATASEDRNHVCHMLTARPKSQTRQALRAKAYTDVPRSWSVFLSQRRRWTLGATSNDLLLLTAPGVQWFERILAGANVMTWFLNPFIFASIASFIFAIFFVPAWIIMCFVSVMLIPIVYYLFIPIWLYKTWLERLQFWAGLGMYIFCGPFINIAVLIYASIYMDSFGWGKTRKVISEDSAPSSENELERLEKTKNESDGNAGDMGAIVSTNEPAQNDAGTASRNCAEEEKRAGL